MNKPPETFELVRPELLRRFAQEVFARAGMPDEKAAFLSDLLVTNDLRGVFSHGTRQVAAYVDHFKSGRLTPNATITTVQETPTTLVLDGGGGLGYFPCYELVQRLVPKAKELHVAVGTTQNHGHFGAAGIYARVPLADGLFCYVTSGHQLDLKPGDFVMAAAGGSPMAFGIPTGEEPPFVLDFGAIHDLYGGPDGVGKIMELAPSSVLRSFGMGCACQALGGLMCGVPLDPARAQRQWEGGNQGSFMIVVNIAALYPLDAFRREMDEYARAVRQLQPLPGFNDACLPGTVEWTRERQFRENGIPIGEQHADLLRRVSQEWSVELPFATR